MTEIYSKRIPLEAEPKTKCVNLLEDIPEKTSPVPLITSLSISKLPLLESLEVLPAPLIADKCPTLKMKLFDSKDTKISTTKTPIPASAPKVNTTKIKFDTPTKLSSKKLQIKGISLSSTYSPMLNDKPQTREMINLKYIPYPAISDIIIKIAEENKLGYTQVQLIGIYDPVPLHLVSGMTLDTFSGKLRFLVGEKQGAKPRFARVAYARIRSTGAIVQTTFPAT